MYRRLIWYRQIHCYWKGRALKISTFWAQMALPNSSNDPCTGSCPHQNHDVPRHINNRHINSYASRLRLKKSICLTALISEFSIALIIYGYSWSELGRSGSKSIFNAASIYRYPLVSRLGKAKHGRGQLSKVYMILGPPPISTRQCLLTPNHLKFKSNIYNLPFSVL